MDSDGIFFKFPRTKHIFDAGGNAVTRDDLLMTSKEADNFLNIRDKNVNIVIEEKVDGANLGISITKSYEIQLQNRAHFVNSSTHRQFSQLDDWVAKHSKDLFKILEPERHILFGEWVYAKHSVHYTSLPDYFLVFDVFDRVANRFYSVKERNDLLIGTNLSSIRILKEGNGITKTELLELLESKSAYYDGHVEGIVLKLSNYKNTDAKNKTSNRTIFKDRAKLVRADFLQQIEEQWTKQKFTKNQLQNYF